MRRAALILTTALVVGACGEGSPLGGSRGGAEGAALDLQVVHPNGVVFQVNSIQAKPDETVVGLTVLNGRDREIELLSSNDDNNYVVSDSGEKLPLVPPTSSARLAIPAGQAVDIELVFTGALPRGENATVVLNENASSDNGSTSRPRFQARLPLDGAFRGGAALGSSRMSGMRPVATSALRTATGNASQAGGLGVGTSSLQAVQALKSELGAVETDRGTVVALPGDVTFDFDQATIREDARPTLDRLAELIQASGGTGWVAIEGHTDSEGADDYNRGLSQRRAEAVKAYLSGKGVGADRLQTRGLGETRPVASNDDDAGRQRNRRVEVILPRAASTTAGAPAQSSGTSTLTPVQ